MTSIRESGQSVGADRRLRVFKDDRLGGCQPHYVLARSGDFLMQIPDNIRKCVAFIGYRKQPAPSPLHMLGTAFFVRVSMNLAVSRGYAITARHVIKRIKERTIDGKVVLRCNTAPWSSAGPGVPVPMGTKGPAAEFVTDLADWHEHPLTTADVAAIPIEMLFAQWDHAHLQMEMAVTAETIRAENISLGDEVFYVGLFTRHPGEYRNVPIIRTGTIACMPEEPIMTKEFGLVDGYLIESRSIGGLSGSPVFVDTSGPRHRGWGIVRDDPRIRVHLLGLIHGHWDMPHVVSDDFVFDIDERDRLNTGIAVVVPSYHISEMLDIPEFKQDRKRQLDEWIAANSPTPDSEPYG